MKLAEWNETAGDDSTPARALSKINFNDFVMTLSQKKEQREKKKAIAEAVDELNELEVPVLLSEQLGKLKNEGA